MNEGEAKKGSLLIGFLSLRYLKETPPSFFSAPQNQKQNESKGKKHDSRQHNDAPT